MWTDYLERNTFIKSLYSTIPDLINVRIESIKVIEEGRKVTLNFIMPIFADKPPAKWTGLGYNTVFVELDFFDIQELALKAQKDKLSGDISIQKNLDGKLVVEASGSVKLNLIADCGMIQSVSGYIDSLH
jgi:hypothetical protein